MPRHMCAGRCTSVHGALKGAVPGGKRSYKQGARRCQSCDVWYDRPLGIRCPCCGGLFRRGRRYAPRGARRQ